VLIYSQNRSVLGSEELHLPLCRKMEFKNENSVQQERNSVGNNLNVTVFKDYSS
jgi:hypothetical protein